jgi:two-component system OmpR family sensor kinase
VSQPFTVEPADQAAPRPRFRLIGELARRLTLRTLVSRMVAGVLVLLIVLISITGTATYLSLRAFLYNRLDQQVSTSAGVNAGALRGFINSQNGIGQGVVRLVYAGEPMWVDFVKSNGQQLPLGVEPSSSRTLNSLVLSDSEVQKFIAHPNRTMSVSSDGEPLRAQSIAGPDGNYMVIGLATSEVQRTLHRLVVLEIVIGLIVLALAAALTSWGVRVGLRPLRRVTRTAQEVTAELGPDGAGLDRRVPVEGAAVEVEQVAQSVNTLLHTVETEFAARIRSEQRMRQFLADASHELRTPLTSIRGYAELARLRGQLAGTDPDAEADDSMRRIEVEGTRMSRLVEDLLVLARGDQGTVSQREPVEVDQLLAEAASAVHSAHPDREFQVSQSGGLDVIGDRDQLLRVLINLATNAAIHTPPSGPIRLEAFAAGPALVGLRVVDAGPGLPPEEAAHVFERFWRADKARSRTKGGSGLGMAIVAQIVQTHGGTVRFDSSVQAGTTVTVLLPARPPAPAGWPAQAQQPAPAPAPAPPAPGSAPPGSAPATAGSAPPLGQGQPHPLPPGWSADPVGAPAGYRPPPATRQN